MTKGRGEARFASVTYSQLAEWTGYAVRTVRHHALAGAFDRYDLADCIRWVNEVRAKRGFRPIGEAPEPSAPAAQLPSPRPGSGGYDPLKASF